MKPNARPARAGVATREAVARRRVDAAYPTEGSAALAPQFADDHLIDIEPVRTRSSEERRAADEAAERRAAEREANAASVANRRKLRVAPPMPVAVAKAPFVAMLLAIVVAGVVGILVLNTMINANQFRLNNLQSQQAGLDQQEQGLKEQLAHQQAPGSLVAAGKCLGLVPAGALAYLKMPNGQLVGVPQPATKTPSVTHQATSSDESTAQCIDDVMDGN
jgi:hypothetical protein